MMEPTYTLRSYCLATESQILSLDTTAGQKSADAGIVRLACHPYR